VRGQTADDGSRAAEVTWQGVFVLLTLLVIFVAAWIILGVIGFVIKGLFWLFVLACVLFGVTLLIAAFRGGRGRRRVVR